MKKITFLLLLVAFNFYGQWTNDPQNANPILIDGDYHFAGTRSNQHSVIVDEAQNIITVFKKLGSDHLFVQKTNINGVKLWGNAGMSIYTGAYIYNGNTRYTGCEELQLVSDNAGGVIIAFVGKNWNNNPDNFSLPRQIMAIRVDGNGNLVWTEKTSVTTPSLANGLLNYYRIVSDGNGGAFVGWISEGGTGNLMTFKLFYQHLHSDGSITFPGGHPLKSLNLTWSPTSSIVYFPTLAKLPSGNIAFSWKDLNPATNNYGLFCNIFTPLGTSIWPNDILVDTGLVSTNQMSDGYPHLLGATNDGVYAMYSKPQSIQLAFLTNGGTTAFSGLEISNASTNQVNYWKFDLTTSPTGDAVSVTNRYNGEPYLQKVNQLGQKELGPIGVNLGSFGNSYITAWDTKIVRTSDNKYLTIFSGLFNGYRKMMTSLNDENGTHLLPIGGTLLFHNEIENLNLLATNYGGAVVLGSRNYNFNADPIVALQVLPANNPIEMALIIDGVPTAMTTVDNLNYSVENFTQSSAVPLSFSKYGMAALYLPTMPSGTASYTANTTNVTTNANNLDAGIYSLSYNAMTNYYSFTSNLESPTHNLKLITLFPNPAVSELHFSKELQHVAVFDVFGKKVLQFDRLNRMINVGNLASGMYLLKGQDGKGRVIVEKFIKK